MGKLIELSPCDIRFMHEYINSKFGDGNSVNETIDMICRGEMRVEDLPRIRVVQMNNSYYAFDNRRLYVYRVLHYRGILDKVTVQLAPYHQFQPERYSTKNNGTSVRLRKGLTYKHSVPGDEIRNSDFGISDSDSTNSDNLEDLFQNLRINNSASNRTPATSSSIPDRSTSSHGYDHAASSTTSSYHRDPYSSVNTRSVVSMPAAPAPKKSESSCIIL